METRGKYPLICAHRGLSKACPENTLPAFAAAAAIGAHEVEFDLRPSKDGVPVVCHDPSVDRTTDGSGEILLMEWGEISALDAGIKHGGQWRGMRVPRLEEAVCASGPDVRLNIHLKSGDVNFVRLVCGILKEMSLAGRAYLACASEEALASALECAPEIDRAVLFSKSRPSFQVEKAEAYRASRVQFGRNAGKADFMEARARGIISNLFFSDEPGEALAYHGMGADVILTNAANLLISGGIPCR